LHLFGVDFEYAIGVVEDERDFSGVGLPTASGTAKDDVGHLLAAHRFDALRAENPLDRIDDVGFPGAVGTDHGGDALGKLEPRAVGKALEAVEFQRFEHDWSAECGMWNAE